MNVNLLDSVFAGVTCNFPETVFLCRVQQQNAGRRRFALVKFRKKRYDSAMFRPVSLCVLLALTIGCQLNRSFAPISVTKNGIVNWVWFSGILYGKRGQMGLFHQNVFSTKRCAISSTRLLLLLRPYTFIE